MRSVGLSGLGKRPYGRLLGRFVGFNPSSAVVKDVALICRGLRISGPDCLHYIFEYFAAPGQLQIQVRNSGSNHSNLLGVSGLL